MKKLFVTFGLAFSFICSFAQNAEQWQQMYGGSGIEIGYGVRSCLDQGYVVAGVSSSGGPTDGYVVRTDSLGLVIWARFYGGSNIDIIRAVELMPDSGFIMAGYTNSFGHGGYDGWLVRLDKNGDTLWTKCIGTADWDFFFDVHVMQDGGFLVTGGTYGLGAGDEDMYLVRTDLNGDTLWTRTYGGIKTDEARGGIETEDSLLAICGFTHSFNDSLGDSWMLRLDSDGDTLWTKNPGFSNVEDKAYGITYDSISDMILFCGYTMSQAGGDGYWTGYFYNQTPFFLGVGGGALFEEYSSIKAGPGLSRFMACGTTYTYGGGMGDMYFFGAESVWSSTSYGTIKEDHAYDIDFTHDGGYILCGSTLGYGIYTSNMYLVKVDTFYQTVNLLAVPEINSNAATSVSVFPVPANDIITMNITSTSSNLSTTEIDIYDITGKLIETISNESVFTTDQHHATASLATSTYSEGIYFYTVRDVNGPLFSNKFMIAR